MHYFIAPRSGEKSYKNFQSTIKHGVPFENIEPYLTPEGKAALLSEEIIYSWGNRPGTKTEWERMESGDTVIFYAKGELVMVGEVYYKQQSPELALAMWPPDENGHPWEYTFFLRNLQYIQLPWKAFKWAAGYNDKFIVRGFIPLLPDRVKLIESQYGSVEEFLGIFKSNVSNEIPDKSDKLYVNTTEYEDPEIRDETSLQPKTQVLVSDTPSIKGAKKANYAERHRANALTGSKGEAIVMRYERDRLALLGREDLSHKVRRISTDDDTVGYDVESFEENGEPRYVEVKTSTGNSKAVRFFMSANEMRKSKSLDNYFIYYVDAINTKKPRIIPIKCPLENKLAISTDTYLLEAELI